MADFEEKQGTSGEAAENARGEAVESADVEEGISELADEELKNVAGGCNDGPTAVNGLWKCTNDEYVYCNAKRTRYEDMMHACGNCVHFEPNAIGDYEGDGICSC